MVEARSQPGPLTPEAVKTRKVVLTPPKLKISDTAEYVTSGGSELRLERTENGLWRCYFYKGGVLPESLSGQFMSRHDLHQAIVQYLRSDNVLGKARWPNA